ncbi:hypothetical protein T4B_14073, partial [Trichinella pseudospiralis]
LLNVLKSNYNVNAYVAIISMRVGKRRTVRVQWHIKTNEDAEDNQQKLKQKMCVVFRGSLLCWPGMGILRKVKDKPAWLRFEIMQCLGFDAAKLLYAILFPFHA